MTNDLKSDELGEGFWLNPPIPTKPSEAISPSLPESLINESSPPCKSGVARPWFEVVLPHEWIFGTFLLLTGLRLLVHGGAAVTWSYLFLGCWLAGVGLVFWSARNLTPARWRVRLLFYPVAMGLAFYALGNAVPLLDNPKVDRLLLAWDRALVGETPSVAWESWLRPWLEDLTMSSYLFFFFYLIAVPGSYCVKDLRLFRKCMIGLFVLYGVAFMGYTVLPAGGPHRWMTFGTPLQGWVLDWTLKPVNQASNSVDVFPSVHVAASLYLLLFDWRHARRRFWLALLPCAILWFSTLYLRFHYFVDVLAGIAVAVAGWWMAQRFEAETRGQPMLSAEINGPHPQRQRPVDYSLGEAPGLQNRSFP
jgi:membrane-associated phospholipid phosphatase